jgi:hypothetical protein
VKWLKALSSNPNTGKKKKLKPQCHHKKKKKKHLVLLFCSAEAQAQGLACAWQPLYH